MNDVINVFRGDNAFLSNFYIAPVFYQGIRFENNEAAFQAAKCPERMYDFYGLTPRDAKRLGRSVELRPDWDTVKYEVMYRICKAKFLQNPDLACKLIDTGDAELIEGNTWGDQVWGICNGVGENNLGKILMRIRDELSKYWDSKSGYWRIEVWNCGPEDIESAIIGMIKVNKITFRACSWCFGYVDFVVTSDMFADEEFVTSVLADEWWNSWPDIAVAKEIVKAITREELKFV